MPDADTHHLLLYTYVPDVLERRGPHREAHLANIRAERDAGRILMAGAFGDPVSGGAFVWRNSTPEQIEAFVAADPYREAGLIVEHRIEPWTLV
jgi:uncharacterized protein